ncbi:MAG: hypothetical protein E6590_10240 [Clostridiales bacterium]|uniref:Uncharacterized protein n=1 Tax=Zhenhengia yiwuensis TaxID=2763666 RepID=A0A926EGY5_9FIRM|nr:hypothetical protein [Zhenhengia yiwuensis]MBC8578385.1 hypothetical protein [Zhenhengia yiwuensis]MDU6360338.1 hypothetical protein [Clostridiales bacterium]
MEKIQNDLSLAELVTITEDFIKLADKLYNTGKITREEYDELTFMKKDFLKKAKMQQQEQINYF